MHPAQPLKVLVQAEHAADQRRWAEILEQLGAEVSLAGHDGSSDATCDVLVTDLAAPGNWPGAVLGIGSSPPPGAEALLPSDFAPRELHLACTLLAQIVRLRAERDELARGQRRASELAETDPLTGLPNRRFWDRHFAAQWALVDGARGNLWLAIVDLDRFKEINEHGGYSAGDEVLRAAAVALAGSLRRDDVIARIGGDEFAVLLRSVDRSTVRPVLERLRAAVNNVKLPAASSRLTASVGYAAKEDHAAQRELFDAAERALRAAKRAGGDRISV